MVNIYVKRRALQNRQIPFLSVSNHYTDDLAGCPFDFIDAAANFLFEFTWSACARDDKKIPIRIGAICTARS